MPGDGDLPELPVGDLCHLEELLKGEASRRVDVGLLADHRLVQLVVEIHLDEEGGGWGYEIPFLMCSSLIFKSGSI